MNMVLIEIIIVNILLAVAMIFEKKTGEIPPAISWLGCVLGILCSVFGDAICSWQEDLIAYGISYVVILILYMKVNGLIGGGVLKMVAMTAVFYGRYMPAVFGLVFVSVLICWLIIKKTNKGGHIMAVPFVFVGSLVTSAVVYFIK